MDDAQIRDLIARYSNPGAAQAPASRADVAERHAGIWEGEAAGGFGSPDRAPELARRIDHTALKAETTVADIRALCQEARLYFFASVCVNPCYVALAARYLEDAPVKVCTVVGFPLGAAAAETKAREAEKAVADGADEVDMVLNVGLLKSDEVEYVERDIRGVVAAVRGDGVLVKVILETALLTDEEKVIACVLARNAGADFVKTSTGFSTGGATTGDVALMRRVVGDSMGVKASGGIRSSEQAERMIAYGATRIGASASVEIVRGLQGPEGY